MLNFIIALIGVALIGLTVFFGIKSYSAKIDGEKYPKYRPIISGIFALVFIIFSLSFTIIPTGYTGVRVTFGQVDERTLPHGFNFHAPIIQSIITVNNKQQDIKFENPIVSETSERNEVTFQGITVTYQIGTDKSAWIYANVTNYEEGLVGESLVASAIKASSKQLDPIDCTNRSIIEPIAKENVQKSINEKYGENVVYINKVVINDAAFDKEYDDKIAKKQQAQIDYETQQIENNKNIEKAEADAKVLKKTAEAEAEAKIIAAEAEAEANKKVSESINGNILSNKYYEKWDGKLPTTMLGDDSKALVNINPSTATPTSAEEE
jgi:regulator of protease activity HflC (stomatin/prohibitin superfamily)